MIKLEPLNSIGPGVLRKLSDLAKSEYTAVEILAPQVLARSEIAFTIKIDNKPVLLFGVLTRTVLGRPNQVWMLACKALKAKHVRVLRVYFRVLVDLFGSLEAYIDINNATAQRFARMFNLRPAKTDGNYIIYEAR